MERKEIKKAERILDFFRDITFDEEAHIYHVDGVPTTGSVTNRIKRFYLPFDAKKKSYEISLRDNIPQEEILASWKNAGDVAIIKGNKAHLFGELYAFNRNLRPQSQFDVAIMKFWEDLPDFVVPVLTEARMYHKKYLYAGTADILLYNTKTGKYIVGDYKSNKDLWKNFQGQKMLTPFTDLLDCPFNHYQLQLSYYQILLEQIEGIEVSYRKIIWLRPDGTYELHDTMDYTQLLRLNDELCN